VTQAILIAGFPSTREAGRLMGTVTVRRRPVSFTLWLVMVPAIAFILDKFLKLQFLIPDLVLIALLLY
jgi:hypothetical protein